MKNPSPNKYYLNVTVFVVLIIAIVVAAFTGFYFVENNKSNRRALQNESENIKITIHETFDYANRISGYIGNQIARHGAGDLRFVASLLKESADNKNFTVLSWTSFDWIVDNYQVVNSRLGIRHNRPYMSGRPYIGYAQKNPWQLQVSPPIIGIPSGIWVIPGGTGVTDNHNRFLGVVALGFNVNELTNKIQQRLNNKNVSFVVLDKDQNIIVQSTDNQLSATDNFYKKNKSQLLFNNQKGVLSKPILVDGIKYSHYQQIADYNYVILTGFNQEFLSQQFGSLVLPRILEFVLVTIFFIIILYILKTRIMSLLTIEQNAKYLDLINKSKTRLIKATSHDLKNYIFGISGLAQLILEKKTPDQISNNEDMQFIKIISDQSIEMAHFVEDLLDTNQNETGLFSLGKIEECDLNELTQRIVLLNKTLSLKCQVDIKINNEPNLPKLVCNARRMKQIFNNIITNAVKYSSANTTLTIAIKYLKPERQICIEFQDQGIGMDEGEIKMAFAGDGQDIDKSILDKPIDSHGIGLPIVKQLVELHNGKMEIESKKGRGSKIILYFPMITLSKDDNLKKSNNNQEIKINSSSDIKNKTILLVEDNPVNVRITSKILENAGYKVKSAENGKRSIEMLDRENFDIIVMDGEMPIMDGFETTEQIRSGKCFKNFKNYKTIPIVALMGNSDVDTIRKAQDCGMNSHVTKSASGKEILDIIGNFFE